MSLLRISMSRPLVWAPQTTSLRMASTHLGKLTELVRQSNSLFQETYGIKKETVQRNLGLVSPVMLLHGDNLIFLYKGTSKVIEYVPAHYHLIKGIAHTPCTIHTLDGLRKAGLAQPEKERQQSGLLQGILKVLADEGVAPALKKHEPLMKKCLEILKNLHRDSLASELLLCKTDLEELIQEAAVVRTNALHAHVQAIKKQVCPLQWNRLAVIVMGPRMPREGELGMQYANQMILSSPEMRQREQCPHLNGTLTESTIVSKQQRLIYAESIDDVKKALELLTAELCDEDLGDGVLNDRTRMRADFLKNAVQEYVKTLYPLE